MREKGQHCAVMASSQAYQWVRLVILLLLVGQVKAAGVTPPTRLYPHGEDMSDPEVVCRRSNWGVSRPVAFPRVKLFDNIYTKVLVVYTHGYVSLSQRLNVRTPVDIRKAMTPKVKQRSRRYGFAILAPLWTDNDCSRGKTFYHVYDSTKTTSDPAEKVRMEAIMELAKDDVIKYSGELDFVPTWVIVVTWRNMLPRLNYDATLDKPNTFQLVFISDTIKRKTYALYLYESVGWDRTLHRRPSTVGYYVTRYRRIRTKTLWMSNTTSAFRIGELVGNTGEVGKYFFPLTYSSTSSARTKCLQWHQAEKLKLSDIELRLKETLSCPCDLPQISADGRWMFDWQSFVSGHKSLCYNERQPGAQSSQYCCYDQLGALITAKDGSGGRLFLYHPRNTTEHRVHDVLPKKWCCDQSKNCGKFYEVRPMNNCLETTPPIVANVNGGWNDWSDWSTCSMTSSGLTKTRSRRCNNPAPEGDGLACLGVSVESDACDIIDCPTNVNSSCGDWSDWSVCSTTCGGGTKTRSRSCDTPIPEGEGLTCLGLSVESETCNINDCPAPAGPSR